MGGHIFARPYFWEGIYLGGHIFGRAIYWEGMGGHPCTNTILSKKRTLLLVLHNKFKSVVKLIEKIMVFANTILHTNNLYDILNLCGIKTVKYHGEMKPSELKEALKSFNKSRDISVIVSCGKLDEDFDLPKVKVIVDFTIYVLVLIYI